MESSSVSSGAASQQPFRISPGAWSPPMTSTAARTDDPPGQRMKDEGGRLKSAANGRDSSFILLPSSLDFPFLFLDLQGQLGVDVPAVVAGAVRELGVAALGAGDVVDRLEGVVRAALALAGLAGLLDGKHVA